MPGNHMQTIRSHLGHVRALAIHHLDAVDDGANTYAQRAARAVLGDVGQMGLGVKCDGLVP